MTPEREISEVIIEATMVLGKIDDYIEKTWDEVKKEGNWAWWWDEKELILPFYFHLRPKIEELNNILKKTCLFIIPEYALKASSYAKSFGKKYPVLKKGRKEYSRTKKVDLSIVAFDSDDFERKKTDSRMTYWYIKHAPVVLLEFKLLSKEFLLPAMKKDLKKLREIEQKYEGVKRVYFCYLADEILSEEEYQTIVGETKIENLRVCHGTSNGKDWEVI